jgi:hypothetical protein
MDQAREEWLSTTRQDYKISIAQHHSEKNRTRN